MDKVMYKLLPFLFLLTAGLARAEVVVIGNPALPKLDPATIQKVFTGRLVEVGDVAITPVNAAPGGLRRHFLAAYLNQDEEQYRAYWTVRRFIGKGAPPRDLASPGDIIEYVQLTPGAVGYIDSADLKPGLNVLSRR
ncbi:hypothetical protein DLREEDagrD3_18640 [Denitratisoma sp. agr-D3]